LVGNSESAGINRHVVGDERALRERKAANPSWPRDRKQHGEGKPETFTFLGFTHFCGQLTTGAFIVWRITAKKRMVAKLKAIKAELQRRKHERTTAVGAWLRKVVLGYYRYHAVPGNST
jgi:RNA-directed DNA polymerase